MDSFTKVIGQYLDTLAASDGMFAHFYKTNGKDVPDCCNYIIQEVRKTGRTGFADEEIYGMAKHYFEEADIKPCVAKTKCNVVTNESSQEKFKDTKAAEAKTAPKKAAVHAEPEDMPEDIFTASATAQPAEEPWPDNLFAQFGF